MRAVRLEELEDGRPVRVSIGDRAIMVVRVDTGVRALDDACPHNGGPLSEGVVRDGCVTCPWHFWRFSLDDGVRQGAPGVAVRTYPCRVVEGWVEVDLPPAAPVRSLREILLASARGEEPG